MLLAGGVVRVVSACFWLLPPCIICKGAPLLCFINDVVAYNHAAVAANNITSMLVCVGGGEQRVQRKQGRWTGGWIEK